jgi:7-cyano-7-deazaguanine synthase
VLLSGGLDSAVAAACVRADGDELHALSFDYGQRHRSELDAASHVAAALDVRTHRVVRVDLRAIGGSALTDDLPVPRRRPKGEIGSHVPSTYVPARNTVFLSIGLSLAETLDARRIVIGANALDYAGYPDCREPFLQAFEQLASVATAAGTERGVRFRVHAPLLHLSKAEIVLRGVELGAPLSLTHSCYDPIDTVDAVLACGDCDSCVLRANGFRAAGVSDPTAYARAPS